MTFYLKRVVVECSEKGLRSDVRETILERMSQFPLNNRHGAAALDKEAANAFGEAADGFDAEGMVSRDCLEGWIRELSQSGLEVIILRENMQFVSKKQDKQDIPALYITDSPQKAHGHIRQGEPVMALLTAENQGEDFAGVKYLSMHLTEISADYLDKVYRRYAGIPWDILETERCFLRETTESDVDAFYEIYADPSITAYMENLYPDREQELAYTRDYIKNVYELYGHGVWTVCLKETGQVIGRAGLSFREGFEDAELGFVIGVTWQGRGIATEVCKAVLEFGARELGFERVIAFVEPDNRISRHLLKKLGFEEREEVELGGKTHVLYRKS